MEPHLTPRQAELLELAQTGLADDEIAARLGVSLRSVRFLFEKAFDELGVRDRVEAVAVWSNSMRQAGRFAERCPYERPFPDDFADCPTYRAVRVAALNLAHQPAGRIWTCQHLQPKVIDETEAGWYAGCAVGRPADRERWAAHPGRRERLLAMNQLASDLAGITGPLVTGLLELKRRQRAAVEAQQDPHPATRDMEALRDRFLVDLEALLRGNGVLLASNQLSAGACLDVARHAIDGLLPTNVPADWNVRYDILLGLPAEAWPG